MSGTTHTPLPCRRPATAALGLAFSALLALGPAAHAASYKFYDGGDGYTGPYSGAGTVYDMTKSLTTLCPTSTLDAGSGTCPSGDVFGEPMVFDGVAASSSSSSGATRVWNDLAPDFAGLGVDTIAAPGSGEDQIEGEEVLTLTFDERTKLTGVGTLFVGSHDPFGSDFPDPGSVATVAGSIEFEMRVDSALEADWFVVNFMTANMNMLSIEGTAFDFRQRTGDGENSHPTFYVGAVVTDALGDVSEVPIPAALPLFASALSGLGLIGWRRRRRPR